MQNCGQLYLTKAQPNEIPNQEVQQDLAAFIIPWTKSRMKNQEGLWICP